MHKAMELKRCRDRALYEAYCRELRDGGHSTTSEIVDAVLGGPAPSFFIAAKPATTMVSRLLATGDVPGLNRQSKRRVREIARRYLAMCSADPSVLGRPLTGIIQSIVDEPAPEWYLNQRQAKRIIAAERERASNALAAWRRRI